MQELNCGERVLNRVLARKICLDAVFERLIQGNEIATVMLSRPPRRLASRTRLWQMDDASDGTRPRAEHSMPGSGMGFHKPSVHSIRIEPFSIPNVWACGLGGLDRAPRHCVIACALRSSEATACGTPAAIALDIHESSVVNCRARCESGAIS